MISSGYSKPTGYAQELGIEDKSATKRWYIRTALLTIAAVLVFTAGPSFGHLPFSFEHYWPTYIAKYHHPLTPLPAEAGSHEAKLVFRLTVPLIAHALHFEKLGTYVLLGVCGLITCCALPAVFLRATGDKTAARWLCLAFAGTHVVTLFFQPVTGFFDGVAFCLLTLACAATPLPSFALLILAACFTDERAILASTFVPTYKYLIDCRKPSAPTLRGLVRSPYSVTTLVVVGAYFALRFGLDIKYGLTSDLESLPLLRWIEHLETVPMAFLFSLKALWLVAAAPAFIGDRRRLYVASVGFPLCALLYGAVVASDMTRSFCYCFPLVFVAAAALDFTGTKRENLVLAILAAVTLLAPNYEIVGLHQYASHSGVANFVRDCILPVVRK